MYHCHSACIHRQIPPPTIRHLSFNKQLYTLISGVRLVEDIRNALNGSGGIWPYARSKLDEAVGIQLFFFFLQFSFRARISRSEEHVRQSTTARKITFRRGMRLSLIMKHTPLRPRLPLQRPGCVHFRRTRTYRGWFVSTFGVALISFIQINP